MMDQVRSWRAQLRTVPNQLSCLRLALIPLICLVYKKQAYKTAAALVVASGLTDMLDGCIARRCDLITDLGKILDPIADKLTQLALVLLLWGRYRWFGYLLILFAVKELFMAIAGILVLHKRGEVHGAIWCGKVSTAVFYCVTVALVFFPAIHEAAAQSLGILSADFQQLHIICTVHQQ